jgi:beta-lactamase class A
MTTSPRTNHLAILLTTAVITTTLLTSCSAAGSPTPTAPSPSSAPPSSATASLAPASLDATTPATTAAFAALEKKYSADLGVSATDVRTGRTVAYNAGERFAFASTYKALAAGVLFDRETDAQLAATVHYTSADLVDYSPITERHVATGMSLHDVIAAALQYSDNTAANLMLKQLGGPAALQKALRALGDSTTNTDRPEPGVNTAIPGDLAIRRLRKRSVPTSARSSWATS